jgi:hypothetical protein
MRSTGPGGCPKLASQVQTPNLVRFVNQVREFRAYAATPRRMSSVFEEAV